MGVSSKIGVLIFILWMRLTPQEYCATQSPSDPMGNSVCIGSGNQERQYYTLGQRPMQTGFDQFTRFHEGVGSGNTYPSVNTINVQIHAMARENTDNYLVGWLFIYIRPNWYNNKPVNMDLLYAQMEDENGNAVGEFQNYRLCGVKPPFPEEDLDEFFPPCGQVAPAAAQVSNAVHWMHPDEVQNRDEKEVVADYYRYSWKRTSGIDVVWKLSYTSCNKPEKIRLRAHIKSRASKGGGLEGTHRTAWMKVKNWTGAADVLQPNDTVNCRKFQLYNGPTHEHFGNAEPVPWSVEWKPGVDIHNTNRDIVRTKLFCKNLRVTDFGADFSNIPSFGGRCLKHDDYKVSHNNKHECTAGATADPSFMKYSQYLKKRISCMKISRCPCQCKPTLEVYELGTEDPTCPGFEPPVAPSQSGAPAPPLRLGYSTEENAGKSIMEHRKLHGIAMLVVTLSFVPISITLSRYFKETWIQRAHLQVLHVWYLVHVALTFMTLCMYLVGSIAIMRSTKVMGRSFVTSSMYHKLLGTGTILLFPGTVLIGSVRHIKNSVFRKIMMITHALLGFIYYFLGILTAITSSWIPGSPSSDNTECIDSPKFMENSTWTFLPYLVGWVGVDLIFHIVFTVLQCVADKGSEYKRPMYFPIVPILKGGETHDTPGKPIRVLLFLIYCGINVGITFTLVVKIIRTSKAGCGFGPTTCTHSDLHTPLGMDICGI